MPVKRQKPDFRIPAALVLIVLLGAGIRFRQFLVGRSLWVDEAALALNIVNRSPSELLLPLDFLQGAPAGFLLLAKGATEIGDTSELWLRLVPFLSSILILILFPLITRRFLSPPGILMGLALLALSSQLIDYATETKQYATDVVATVFGLTIYTGIRAKPLAAGRSILLALAGVVMVWLSHPAVFVLGAVGLVALIEKWGSGDRRQILWLAVIGASWVAAFTAMYLLTLDDLTQNERLAQFWGGGFPPSLASGMGLVTWLWHKFHALSHMTLGVVYAGLASLALIAGLVSFFRRDKALLGVLAGPVILMLIAATLRAYPFADRLLLYTAPLIAILIAEGTVLLVNSLRPVSRILAYAVPILILFQPSIQAWELIKNPQYKEELRPVLAYIDGNRRQEDHIYLYYSSYLPFEYYRSRFGIEESDFTFGIRSREDWDPYFEELAELSASNRRVWMVFSHVYTEGGANEESLFLNYLKEAGHTPVDQVSAYGAAAYLFDFRRE
jgi:hypothetical protein